MKQYPTTPQDWFNYIAQGKASNALIQYIIKLDRTINYDTLKKAVYNSILTEPVKNKLSFCASYYTPNMQPVIVEKLLREIEYFLIKLND